MKVLKILSLILLLFANSYAQILPNKYRFDSNILSKIADSKPLSNSITDIITSGSTVILATSRGLSISFDNGLNWKNYYNTEPFGNESIVSIGFHDGVIWAATATVQNLNGQDIDVGTGLKYSEDLGESWVSLQQPVDDPGDSIIVYGINNLRALPVTVPQQNLIYDIAFAGDTIYITTWAGGLRRSIDKGNSWKRVVLPPDYLDSITPLDTLNFSLQPKAGNFGPEEYLNHVAFSVVTNSLGEIYVGTANGINKSIDGGISWVKMNHQNQQNSISGNFITALGYNQNNNSIWAASWKAEGQSEFYGVSYSYDGGLNWNTSLVDERPHNFGFKDREIFVAATGGIFRSTNNGLTWIVPQNIKDYQTGQVLNTDVFYSVEVNTNDIWLGSNNGLAKLREEGNIWQGEWTVYIASGSSNSINESFAYPNPFSPALGNVRIAYSLQQDSEVTIRIMDFGMNLVKTIIQNAPRTISNSIFEIWEGTDEAGNIVPNGVYFYRIDIGDSEPLFGKIIVLK